MAMAREHFITASRLVEEMNYGRRAPEIADVRMRLG